MIKTDFPSPRSTETGSRLDRSIEPHHPGSSAGNIPIARILAEHPFSKSFSKEHLQVLLEGASFAEFRPGQLIFQAGQPTSHFYLIQQGNIGLGANIDFPSLKAAQRLGAGHILGWAWLIPPFLAETNAIALESTTALSFDTHWLQNKCQTDRSFGYAVAKRVSHILLEHLRSLRLGHHDVGTGKKHVCGKTSAPCSSASRCACPSRRPEVK